MLPFRELKSRLSIRVALAVFVAIVVVEIAILVPSARNFESDQKARLFERAKALSVTLPELRGEALAAGLSTVLADPRVLGVALVGTAARGEGGVRRGDLPAVLAVETVLGAGRARCDDRAGLCDIAFRSTRGENSVFLRLDSSWIDAEVTAFIWRIAGLVLLISGFVTAVTMAVVASRVIRPILMVQSQLARVRAEPELVRVEPVTHGSRDELGDTISMLNDTLVELAESRRQAVQSEEQRFLDFAMVASDWFWEMDEDLRFSYFSDRFTEITGVPQERLLGFTRQENGNPGVEDAVWQSHLKDLANHSPFREFIHPSTKPNGREVWLSTSGRPHFHPDGRFAGYRGIGSDITGRVASERQILQAKDEAETAREHADRANLAKSEFLSSMSHELRTPLNGILGFGQLLELDDDNTMSDRQKAAVTQILSAGAHLLELIEQILDLSRIEQGQLEVTIEPTDLVPVLEECLSLLDHQTEGRDLRIDLPPDWRCTPRILKADPVKLRQILLNLLSNALKYNTSGTQVGVRCRAGAPGFTRFEVWDDGPGIPPDKVDSLFTPFDRLGMAAKNIPGTGIGLTICQRLVSLMGGEIGYLAGEPRGSVFWFEIPIAESGAVSHQPDGVDSMGPDTRAPDPPGDRLTVLYIEDNAANMQLMAHIFEIVEGARLISAVTAEEGLELARTDPPDLIFMDINLPGMDGIEACRALQADPCTANIPVIAVSAAAMPGDLDRAREAGFESYITKPIQLPEILAAVERVRG